jgi:hypothetical protein
MRLLLLLILLPQEPDAVHLCVDPAGDDAGPGTEGQPFATLARARDAARAHAGKRPVTILLHDGLHVLKETFVLRPEDSGVAYAAVHPRKAVVSGGRRITGWKRGEKGVWTAESKGPAFRQLFVNGERRIRARSPNEGAFFRVEGEISLDREARFKAKAGDLDPEWGARGGVEVIALQSWAEIRMPITAIEGETVTLAGQCARSNREKNPRYWVENAIEALDAPREWFLDARAGVVHYRPPEGEDPNAAEVIAASLPCLVRLEGDPSKGRFVSRVRFRGIAFAHQDWTLGERGYTDVQAAHDIPAAIQAAGALDCAIEDGRVSQVGGYGIDFSRGCRQNRIVGNEITDTGAGGLRLGETVLRREAADQTRENEVTDNEIHRIGLVYPAGVAIWVGHSGKNRLAHNHLHHTYYSGFSIGWSWGYGPSGAGENLIEQNRVHHIGQGMLADMGGIYTLGTAKGTVIRNNVFHDVWSSTYGGWGIYFDEGSTQILAENNVAYRCKSNGFHQHYGRENVLRNNVFALNQESQIARTRPEPHPTLTVERNLVYWTTGSLLSGNWKDGTFKFEKNLYWNPKGGAGTPAEWKEKGWDKDSIVADPLFVDPEKGDFTLKPGSPALALGFTPIDVSKVGPRKR